MTILSRNISRLFGGNLNVAKALGLSSSYISQWALPHEKRGNGGLVPAKYQVRLLAYAKAHDIDLRPDDFFYPDRLAAIIAANPEKYPPIKRGRKRRADD